MPNLNEIREEIKHIGSPMGLPTGYPAGNKPHPAEKISGLASDLAHLGRIC